MENDVVENVIKAIDRKISRKNSSSVQFSDKRYRAIAVSDENFREITENGAKNAVAFVDGGNAEIFSAPNLSLQFIRTYYTIFENNKKTKSAKNEFYLLVYAEEKGDDIYFKSEIFALNGTAMPDKDNLAFNSFDATIKHGKRRAAVSKIADIARRFAELKTAEKAIESLGKNDIVVLDGTLEAVYTNENRYLNSLYEKAKQRNAVITALAKTNTLFTDKGDSFPVFLNEKAPFPAWYYYPVAEISNNEHEAELYMIKLNKRSEHVFRFEVFNKADYKISDILSVLAENSNDAVFVGYPYGSIEADRFARVTNNEKEYFKTLFVYKMGNKFARFSGYFSPVNAHDILDKAA